MLSIIQAIVLGIFQGIAEFLPISSSGHLTLLQELFGMEEGSLFFTVMLHFGTLLSVFIVYFRDIVNIVKEFISLIKDLVKEKRIKLDNEYKILGVMIIVGTIPTGIMGVLLNDFFEGLYSSITSVGVAFLITGLLLWIAEKKTYGYKDARQLKFSDALIVGFFQGFAIAPGISRAGATIVGALFRGLNKKLATRFSFLLSIPAILGASLLELIDALSVSDKLLITFPILVGISLATISGIIAINILIKLLENGKLHYFSYYVWALGILTIVIGIF